jgi:hypothetical protein
MALEVRAGMVSVERGISLSGSKVTVTKLTKPSEPKNPVARNTRKSSVS